MSKKINILQDTLVQLQKQHVADYVSPKQLAALITVVQNTLSENDARLSKTLTDGLRMLKKQLDIADALATKTDSKHSNSVSALNESVKAINKSIVALTKSLKALEDKEDPEEYDDIELREAIDEVRGDVESINKVLGDRDDIFKRNNEDIGEAIDNINKRIDSLEDDLKKVSTKAPTTIFGTGFHRSHIKDVDISSLLDGSTKTFDIGAIYSILSVSLSSYPYGTLRKNIDYSYGEHTITFEDTIAADIQLAAGQRCVLTVITT